MESATRERRTSRRTISVLAVIAAAVLLVPVVAAHAVQGPALAWSTNGTFDYGAVYPGQTASQTFTLTNVGHKATGMLTVVLTGSASFTKTVDTCTGNSLGPTKSCSVTVQFAPVASGQAGTGTLYASSKKAGANGSLILVGPPNLHLSPGTLGFSSGGANSYDYSLGAVSGGQTSSQLFTVTNDGNGTTATLEVPLFSPPPQDPGGGGAWAVLNDTCTGGALAPTGQCAFVVSFTAPAGCSPQTPYYSDVFVHGVFGRTYDSLHTLAFCL